ncbi:MAG: hypothetical protein ACRD6X_18235 [Pyrinomonadaceae bacterium]
MLMKYILISMIALLINLTIAPVAFASGKSDKGAGFVEKLRANIEKQGTGADSKIRLKLKNGSKVNGYISEIAGDGFTVIEEKTAVSTFVPYSQVKQAKGNNWSQNATFIVLVVGFLVFVIIAVAASKD